MNIYWCHSIKISLAVCPRQVFSAYSNVWEKDSVDQTYFNETSFDPFQCISDNDTAFNKREGLYTERIRRTCTEHQILRVTYLKRYFLVLSSSRPTSSRSEEHDTQKIVYVMERRIFWVTWSDCFNFFEYLIWLILRWQYQTQIKHPSIHCSAPSVNIKCQVRLKKIAKNKRSSLVR